ncbi:hypothetical protein [Adlercreutzia sp. ZJ473]|nr:hypothetical protein [Adlercreutzia sp. ZJ473]
MRIVASLLKGTLTLIAFAVAAAVNAAIALGAALLRMIWKYL